VGSRDSIPRVHIIFSLQTLFLFSHFHSYSLFFAQSLFHSLFFAHFHSQSFFFAQSLFHSFFFDHSHFHTFFYEQPHFSVSVGPHRLGGLELKE
jgi:hypothetical protein